MTWDRIQRQEAILREKVAVLVQRLNDPRLGFITITAVKLSRDKHYATVSYTVLGDEAQIRTTSRALSDAARRIQEMLAPSLRMRTMPELRFYYDAKVEKQNRLLGLIEQVTAARLENEPAAEGAELDGDDLEASAADADDADADDADADDAEDDVDVDAEDDDGKLPDVPSTPAAWAGAALRAEPTGFEDESFDPALDLDRESDDIRGEDDRESDDDRDDNPKPSQRAGGGAPDVGGAHPGGARPS